MGPSHIPSTPHVEIQQTWPYRNTVWDWLHLRSPLKDHYALKVTQWEQKPILVECHPMVGRWRLLRKWSSGQCLGCRAIEGWKHNSQRPQFDAEHRHQQMEQPRWFQPGSHSHEQPMLSLYFVTGELMRIDYSRLVTTFFYIHGQCSLFTRNWARYIMWTVSVPKTSARTNHPQMQPPWYWRILELPNK